MVVCGVIISSIKKSRTADNQRRVAPPTTNRSTGATSNNNNTDRPSIQLNTISSTPSSQTQSTLARQPPPQYLSSNTLPSSTNIPSSYPKPPPPFPASGGFYVFVPTGTALPASTAFYPYPGQQPQYQTEVNEGSEEAGKLHETEPPRYDELFENTTAL